MRLNDGLPNSPRAPGPPGGSGPGAPIYHKIQGGTLSILFCSVPYSFGSMGQNGGEFRPGGPRAVSSKYAFHREGSETNKNGKTYEKSPSAMAVDLYAEKTALSNAEEVC